MGYSKIVTSLPNKEDLKLIEELNKYSPKSMQTNQLPVVWKNAIDYIVFDRHGNEFIDFTSGIFSTNSGHGNEEIKEAIDRTEFYHSYTFSTEIKLKYLKELTEFTGYEKAFLLSAGTEATEAACKIMRKANEKNIILSFKGAMHGKTFFAEALKGVEYSQHVKVLDYPTFCTRFEELISHISTHFIDNCAGIIVESYRGWDAQLFLPSFIQDLMNWAKKKKILVCFDEIQSGFGRTGKLFCYEWYKIKPDLVCCGKGLGGGIPISAVLGSAKLLDSVNDLSSTNSANPLVCAGALANLQYIKQHKLIENSFKLGKILEKRLGEMVEKFDIVTGCNSIGLVGALIVANEVLADCICFKCMQKGLLVVKTGRESIKIGPPLVINKGALEEGLQILEESIKEIKYMVKN